MLQIKLKRKRTELGAFSKGYIIQHLQGAASCRMCSAGDRNKQISAEILFSLPICVIMEWVMKNE